MMLSIYTYAYTLHKYTGDFSDYVIVLFEDMDAMQHGYTHAALYFAVCTIYVPIDSRKAARWDGLQ